MAHDGRAPVLVGVGQVRQRTDDLDEAMSPARLVAEAVRAALDDAGGRGVDRAVESVRFVRTLSWPYADAAVTVAGLAGLAPHETCRSVDGGNTPQMLVNLTASEVAAGSLDCAVLCGGETWRTRTRYERAGRTPPWEPQPEGVAPTRVLGHEVAMHDPFAAAAGANRPVHVYPLFEVALRATRGEEPSAHLERVSRLWARFSEVASRNPHAWLQDARSAEEIRTPGPRNRMISTPYPKLMNSNNDVDLAAAVVVCSSEKADELGIPRDRRVFVHAGTDAHDHDLVSYRADLCSSPAIRLAGRRAMALAGIGPDDVALVDLYSCFPSAVQVAALELGFGLDRDLTVTGGLGFAGGPWNDYVMHALATTVTRLREAPGAVGFVSANGGYLTKHAFGVYSTEPPSAGFRHEEPQAEVDALPRREVVPTGEAVGGATVESYTVAYGREGEPERAIAALLAPDGRRAWASSDDRALAAAMTAGEWVGRRAGRDAAGRLAVD